MEHILDKIGLTYFWGKIKATFAKKSELEAHPTARIYMGSCSTAAATNPKVCNVEDFPLDAEGKPLVGTLISVKFSATNTSTSTTPQLNVNETGAIRIWYNNAVLATAKSAYAGYANRYINYMYDGTYWVFLGHSTDNNTTYSALTQAKIDAGTETTGRLISADLLRDNFYTEGEVDDLLSGKEDTISDLEDIRSGAALGATALQSFTESDPTVPSWAKQSTKPSYTASEVGALPDTTVIPTKVSQLTNDSGFTTNTGTITGITMNGVSKGTSGNVNLGTVLTEHQSLAGKQDVISDLATIRSGASAGATAYQKPSAGIPKTDLASAVQTSLGKADTALQSHQDISGKADVAALAGYTPTANFATINGASITGGGDIIITAGSSSITTIDAVPTKNSTNPVQSGGVYDAIEGGFYY